MKPPYFSLNIRLLFPDLFRIRIRIRIRNRIRNVYFVSGSDPVPAKSFGSLRIRIRNTAKKVIVKVSYKICSRGWSQSRRKYLRLRGAGAERNTFGTATLVSVAFYWSVAPLTLFQIYVHEKYVPVQLNESSALGGVKKMG